MTATQTTERSSGDSNPDVTIAWHGNVPDNIRLWNCEIAMSKGLPALGGITTMEDHSPCVVVGSGLTAVKLLPEIRARHEAGEKIFALKGAHDWLIDNGIVPNAAIAVDAQQSRAKCFTKPHPNVLYLCASQMHPDTWDHLRGYQVVIWHQLVNRAQLDMPHWKGKCILMGASTTGNGALFLLHTMGKRNVHLYGIDSSIPAPHWWSRWIRPVLKLDGARVRDGNSLIQIVLDGKTYWSTPEMVMQAEEFPLMVPMMKGMEITPHGDGYYQAVVRYVKGAS